MRLKAYGIMGGTFDPIHNGHLSMAEAAMNQLKLDEVLFIPDGDPPHKAELAPAEDRLRMVALAVAGRSGFQALDVEVRRAGQTFSSSWAPTRCWRWNPGATSRGWPSFCRASPARPGPGFPMRRPGGSGIF